MAKKKDSISILNNSWVGPYLSQNKWLLTIVIVLGVGTFFSAGALMFTSGYLISKSATLPENILLVYVPIVLVRLFGVSRPAFRYAERLSSHSLVLKILSSMRVRLYRTLEPDALDFKSRYKTGDLLGVMADDIEHLQDLYIKTIFPSIISIGLYMLIVLALGFFSIPFALLMFLLLFVLIILFPLVSLLVTRARHAQMKNARNGLYQSLTDAVMGIGDWMISGRQSDFIECYEKDEKKVDVLEAKINLFQRKRNFLFQAVILVIIVALACWITLQVEAEQFSPIWIAAFILVVFPLVDAFAPLSDAVSQVSSYKSSLERMNGLQEEKELIGLTNNENTSEFDDLKAQTALPITFNQISFSYSSTDEKVLNNLNFTIQPGEKIAMLGKSGAGKSTIVKLLLGAYKPNQGKISIGNKDISLLDSQITSFISVLHQKPHLFDTTVMNNIRLGNPNACDEEVYEAAKLVRMHDYIESLPNGYQTRMHELGGRFSGGERQRIALARILLQKNPIVILDEPTVGLDSQTERSLLETIFKTLNGKTMIWITHHLMGVEKMDRVLFLQDGEISMNGSHEELLQMMPHYTKLYKLDMPQLNN
ncbi:thiol reductant ABC exporter subunit CydC [Bacillus sp. FJAT-27986]|uniref:thiol reductant ABC exporter subunit CydC n=1 Tax=Bacillus sp. FJAT-27986 TaxID=1743146 RepID=UPI00080AC31C|nr:thiol reductant ABC exporter subunit CydC [Bacillus sp. FJAT-27986]OCA86269.1 thiol reductant ABC exporter subunit CydC [Bacillus sp. FJAT-27986]